MHSSSTSRTGPRRGAAWLTVALLALATQARADDEGVVIEAYTGARPGHAARLVAPVLEALADHGFVTGVHAVGRRFEQRASIPSAAPDGLPADFADQVERGHKAWITGKFDEAVGTLAPLIAHAHANAAAFTQNQVLRDRLKKGLIALALSQHRSGDSAATRVTFAELLRTFPGATVARAAYGPEAYALFERLRADIEAEGRGRLTIKPRDGEAVVFINESFADVGATTKTDLMPGTYRVVLQLGKQRSRTHLVTVNANNETTLEIDPGFDAAVHSAPDWTGLVFRDARERGRLEATHAAMFGRAVNARTVAVVGIAGVDGKLAVTAARIDVGTGREVWRSRLELSPAPSVAQLRALGRALAGAVGRTAAPPATRARARAARQ